MVYASRECFIMSLIVFAPAWIGHASWSHVCHCEEKNEERRAVSSRDMICFWPKRRCRRLYKSTSGNVWLQNCRNCSTNNLQMALKFCQYIIRDPLLVTSAPTFESVTLFLYTFQQNSKSKVYELFRANACTKLQVGN